MLVADAGEELRPSSLLLISADPPGSSMGEVYVWRYGHATFYQATHPWQLQALHHPGNRHPAFRVRHLHESSHISGRMLMFDTAVLCRQQHGRGVCVEVRPGHCAGRLHAHGSLWICTLQGVSPQPVHSPFEGLAAGPRRSLRPVGPASSGELHDGGVSAVPCTFKELQLDASSAQWIQPQTATWPDQMTCMFQHLMSFRIRA